MKNLILHSVTRQQLDSFINAPSHAVILVGPAGSGKSTMAARLAEVMLGIAVNSFEDYPYKLLISNEDGKAIGIEPIRQLEHFLSLKVPHPGQYNRAVVIENAHSLTLEAQNALLKTLEEPPEGTFIILNASHSQALLPTIRSRAQAISVKRPEKVDIEEHFRSQNFTSKQIAQAYAISGGLPGLMWALLEQIDHPLLQATEQARKLLSATIYERLLMVDELSRQRVLAQDTAFILRQMARVSLQTATGQASQKWQAVLNASFHAAEALATSAQPKLALTDLVLSF